MIEKKEIEGEDGDLLAGNSDKLSENEKWHIAEGRKLTGPYLSRLEIKRSALYHRMQLFLEKYEFLILPVSMQIVGRRNADLSVLQMGYAFEQATNIGRQRPKIIIFE